MASSQREINNEQQIPLMGGDSKNDNGDISIGLGSGSAGSMGGHGRTVSAGASGTAGGAMTLLQQPTQHPALPILSYCLASISMTVLNKYLMSGRHFNLNFLLMCIQGAICVVCVSLAKRAGAIQVRPLEYDVARKWFPIAFMMAMVIYTGSKALQYLPIPVYTIFKNLTIILIAYGEVLWFGKEITAMTLGSFGLMVLSSLIAASDDIVRYFSGAAAPVGAVVKSNSAIGYIWMAINCFVSAGYLLGMKKRISTFNFKDWDSMYYNNLLSIPVLIVFSILFEGWTAENFELNFPSDSRNALFFSMLISGLLTVCISYSTAWCIRVTSSTTYSMVGALNKLPLAMSGLLFFGDPATLSSVSAIFTGSVAGLVYCLAKQNQAAQEKLGGGIDLGGRSNR